MPHVITLVHGTFAKNAAWCKLDSPLCLAISKALAQDVIFVPFVWSGRNSFQDRLLATDDLVNHFLKLRTCYPNSKHSAIAHSHGGNILVNALSRIPDGVDSAVCLATPFLVIQPRPEGRHIEVSLLTICFLAVSLLPITLVSLTTNHISFFASRAPHLLLQSVLTIMSAVAGWKATKLPAKFKLARIESVNERLLASGTKNSESASKMLLMRSPRDEATLSLGVITFANWLIEQVRTILVFLTNWIIDRLFGSPTTTFLSIILLLPAFYFFRHTKTELYLLIGAISASTILSFGFLLSNALLSFGFGMDVFLGVWRIRMSVEASPPGLWQIYGLTTDQNVPGMRHSLPYTSREAIKVIVLWLTDDHSNPLPPAPPRPPLKKRATPRKER
jgi:hypothetical protein